MVDNSQGHSAYAEDALLTSRMNMNPGGKQARLRDGWYIRDEYEEYPVASNLSCRLSLPVPLMEGIIEDQKARSDIQQAIDARSLNQCDDVVTKVQNEILHACSTRRYVCSQGPRRIKRSTD